MEGVQFDELTDAAPYHYPGVVWTPGGAEKLRDVRVVGGARDKGSEVELPGPNPPPVGRSDKDVAVHVSYENLIAIVTPFEVANGGAPVVNELHHRAAVVVPPDNDST